MWRLIIALLLAGLLHAQTSTVVIVHDPLTNVRAMVRAGLTQLTGQTNEAAAWQTFAGSNDVVGIKISTLAAPLHVTHPDLIEAIADGLRRAGVAATNIIVFDRDPRKLADAEYNSPHFKPVAITTQAGGGWDAEAFIDNRIVGKLIHGDLQFGQEEALGTRTHYPILVTRRLTKLINVPVAMDHEATGIAGCLYNVSLAMTDNTRRFEQFGQRGDPAIAEIHARPVLHGKLGLHILDALVAGYAGGPAFKPQYSWPANRIYFSTDPVAIDALYLEQIEARRKEAGVPAVGERASHIQTCAKIRLGQADPSKIRAVTVSP